MQVKQVKQQWQHQSKLLVGRTNCTAQLLSTCSSRARLFIGASGSSSAELVAAADYHLELSVRLTWKRSFTEWQHQVELDSASIIDAPADRNN